MHQTLKSDWMRKSEIKTHALKKNIWNSGKKPGPKLQLKHNVWENTHPETNISPPKRAPFVYYYRPKIPEHVKEVGLLGWVETALLIWPLGPTKKKTHQRTHRNIAWCFKFLKSYIVVDLPQHVPTISFRPSVFFFGQLCSTKLAKEPKQQTRSTHLDKTESQEARMPKTKGTTFEQRK